MKILLVPQGSYPEKELTDAMTEVKPGGYYFSNGSKVLPGNKIDHQTMKWHDAVYETSISFDQACEKYPDKVKEVNENDSPSWGEAWYSEESWPFFWKENWDTT